MTKPTESYCNQCMRDCGYIPIDPDGVYTARLMACPRCKKEAIIIPRRHWVRKNYVDLPRKPYNPL